MKTNPNEQAFATSTIDGYVYRGLSKREYFAAMCFQGILAGVSGVEQLASVHPSSWAITAVEAADALIEELNKEK